MAKPTAVIHRMELTEEQKREQDLQEILNALIENKNAILDVLELMKTVQETELIPILKALVAERDEVLTNVVTFVDGSDLTRSLKNALLLFNTLGQLNVEEMEPLVGKLNGAITEVARQENKRGGYVSLIETLNDPDLIEGLNTTLALLKGLGAKPVDLDGDSKEDKTEPYTKANNNSSKWIAGAAAVGASLFAIRLLFKK